MRGTTNQDIFEILRADHQAISELLEKVERGYGFVEYENWLTQLGQALNAHSAAEEDAVYSRLRELENTDDMLDEAQEDHADITRCYLELRESDPEERSPRVEALKMIIQDHVAEEESEMFRLLARYFSEEKLDEIKAVFLDAKAAALESAAA